MKIQIFEWNVLDGCASLTDVIAILNKTRNDFISMYRAGSVLLRAYNGHNVIIGIKKMSPHASEELKLSEFLTVDTNLLSSEEVMRSCESFWSDDIEPTFQLLKSHLVLQGCNDVKGIIRALENYIYRYKNLYHAGWDLGDPIKGNTGFLFPIGPFDEESSQHLNNELL